MKQTRSPLYPIFLFVIINLIIFTLSRLGLAIWQADRVSAVAKKAMETGVATRPITDWAAYEKQLKALVAA